MSACRFLLILLLVLLVSAGCGRNGTAGKNAARVVIIGVDGMDPGFLERHWDVLPNLRSLRDTGGFRRLGTTTPPQSPVAWSTFITGLEPSGHGIYDFVHRDPLTRAPYSSMQRTDEPRFQVPVGPWLVPLSKAHVVSLRHGVPFWSVLADHEVATTVMRLPTNYPPVQAGRAVAGMGVPDIRGGFGTFTFFTDDPEEITRTVAGGAIVRVRVEDGRAVLPLEGPPNPLRRDQRPVNLKLTLDVDADAHAARIDTGEQKFILQQGEWSDWIPLQFALLSHVQSVRGMVRLYAKQLTPRLQLYVSAVNIDPREPALPISAPENFAAYVAEDVGPYYTQGIAEDTAALRHRIFTMEEYLRQSELVFEDEVRLLRYALSHDASGLTFAYFSGVDQNSHMLWGRYEDKLLDTYRKIDGAIGEALQSAREAAVIVMSDHGFTSFDRSFQLNGWLAEQGFLKMKGPASGEGFVNVDWSRTLAYGLGLNGLYLNLRGRERDGIVGEHERARLIAQLRDQLLGVRDPETGKRVILSVATPPVSDTAPDLIVGYAPGYRASWDTGLGATTGPVFDTNRDAWIGDHCTDASSVPGVLLSNRPIRLADPDLRELPSSILKLFGVEPPKQMQARGIF